MGNEYQVKGRYYAGFRQTQWEPGEPPRFEVLHVISSNGGDVLSATDPENIEAFEAECLKEYEEELAWSEQEAAEDRYQRMKEQTA
jgi:hypothetical protein